MYGDAERRFFLVELRYTRKLWSLEKAVAKNLNVKFRSKFNHGFTVSFVVCHSKSFI